MNSKKPILIKIYGLCGLFSPIVGFISIAFAIYYSDWFSWTENWLSDLGGIQGETPIWAARGISSIIFNGGLIITGIMGFVFANAIRKLRLLNTRLGRIGTSLLILDMFSLCAIGIFPETTGYFHTFVSVMFFFLGAISLLVIGTSLRKSSERTLGGFVTLLSVISIFSFPFIFIQRPWGSNAIIEMVPIISIAIFAMVFGISLIKGRFEQL